MLARSRRLLCLLACAGSLAFMPSIAQATCDPLARPVAPATVHTLRDRFDALNAMDKYKDAVPMAARWKAFLDAASADPGTNSDSGHEILSRAWTWYAWTVSDTPQADQMLAAARKGEAIAREAGLTQADFYHETLAVLSAVETATGAIVDARGHASQALALARQRFGSESSEAAFAEGTLGYIDLSDGHYIDAEAHYAEAERLAIKCSFADDGFTGTMIDTHATTLDSLSRFEDSLAEHYRSLAWALAHASDDSPTRTNAMAGLAAGLLRTNRLGEAAAIDREVIDRQRRYEPDNAWVRAAQLANYGAILQGMGRDDDAEEMWTQARTFYARAKTHQDPWLAVQPLQMAAALARAQGRFGDAIVKYQDATKQLAADVPPDNVRLAGVRVESGMALALAGRAEEGAALAEPALAILRAKLATSDVRRSIAEVLWARITAILHGPEAGAVLIGPPADALATRLLDAATVRTDLIRLAPTFAGGFSAQVALNLAAGHEAAAFRALQLYNFSEIAVVTAQVAARGAAVNPATADLARAMADHVRLRQGLDKERSAAVSGNKATEIARLDAAIRSNDVQIADEGARIDRLFPALRRISRPEPVTLALFQARLTPGQVLLAPVPLENGTLAIAITQTRVVWARTPLNAAGVRARVRRIRTSIEAALAAGGGSATFDMAAARDLFAAIAPRRVAALLRGHKDLLYYSSGALATIPPALLIIGAEGGAKGGAKGGIGGGATLARAHWLVRDHSVTVLPTLAPPDHGGAQLAARPMRFLGVGAPDLGPAPVQDATRIALRGAAIDTAALHDLPPLPRAGDELKAIALALGGSDNRLLTGAEATKAQFGALPLDRYTVMAFATHGLVSGDFPGLQEPALVMTPAPGQPGSGPSSDAVLTASEIAGLWLDADLVILSACDTATGNGAGTPSYSGLTSAFFAAGARAMLVSHWRVRDDAAARLTVDTVRGAARGLPRAAALQGAMLRLMADRSIPNAAHPAFWAPFVLVER